MTKTVHNIHDQTFGALMSNREFAIGFYRAYLPTDVVQRIDFSSLEIFNLSGRVIGEKDARASQVDVVHTVKLDNSQLLLWTHWEHQSEPQRFLPIRVTHYQCGKLLEYAKLNQCKELPPIISIIYYQGRKPYAYSIDVNELFSDKALAKRYFTKPILVDLPAMDDQVIEQHETIGPAEMLLKYIRSSQFPQKYQAIIQKIAILDGKTRHVLIQYLVQRADIDERLLFKAIIENLPQDEDIVMTVAEQIAQRNMQKGVEKGRQETMEKVAINLLKKGQSVSFVAQMTGLPQSKVQFLANAHAA